MECQSLVYPGHYKGGSEVQRGQGVCSGSHSQLLAKQGCSCTGQQGLGLTRCLLNSPLAVLGYTLLSTALLINRPLTLCYPWPVSCNGK